MDSTDRDVVEALLERDLTVHELAKTMFKTTDRHELKKHSSFLRYRLGSLAQDGLVQRRETPDRRTVYHVPLESMSYGRGKIVIQDKRGAITLDLGKVLVTQVNGTQQILVLRK